MYNIPRRDSQNTELVDSVAKFVELWAIRDGTENIDIVGGKNKFFFMFTRAFELLLYYLLQGHILLHAYPGTEKFN